MVVLLNDDYRLAPIRKDYPGEKDFYHLCHIAAGIDSSHSCPNHGLKSIHIADHPKSSHVVRVVMYNDYGSLLFQSRIVSNHIVKRVLDPYAYIGHYNLSLSNYQKMEK